MKYMNILIAGLLLLGAAACSNDDKNSGISSRAYL